MTWPTEEQVARLRAHQDFDWVDTIGSTDHEHSVDCANWEPYTPDARDVLALFPTEALRALVSDWQANGNSRELGDPTAQVWHQAARQLLDIIERNGGK